MTSYYRYFPYLFGGFFRESPGRSRGERGLYPSVVELKGVTSNEEKKMKFINTHLQVSMETYINMRQVRVVTHHDVPHLHGSK